MAWPPLGDGVNEDGNLHYYPFIWRKAINSINPINMTDPFGLCWSTSRAVAHYLNPIGGNVSLAETGCVGQVSAATQPLRNKWKNGVKQKAEAAAKATAPCGRAIKTFRASPGVHSGVWWIGGITLHQRAKCAVMKDCSGCGWAFSCVIYNTMNDRFEHPFDIDNSNSDWWDNVETGFPFYVTHIWNDTVRGSGK